MARDWSQYLKAIKADPACAIVERGHRLDQARRTLSEKHYTRLVRETMGITLRDAKQFSVVGAALRPIVHRYPNTSLPARLRTLQALAELSQKTLLRAVEAGLIHAAMTEADVVRLRRQNGATPMHNTVIRPTDSWNFSTLRWPRIDGEDGHGYVPGDLYANCLWYYSRPEDIVVDPMAGSGMISRVWDERDEWMNDDAWEIELVLSDLVPRGLYHREITACDLLEAFPVARADYIIIDPPYCGLVTGQYSHLPNDLANMTPETWHDAMVVIARRFRNAQDDRGRCTIIVPNCRSIVDRKRILLPEIVRRCFFKAGYQLYDVVYSSRRTQQTQSRHMGVLNNRARTTRTPLADVAEVLTFEIVSASQSR